MRKIIIGITVLLTAGIVWAAYALPYNQDFSEDPVWTTNNAANFKWDSAGRSYYAKSVLNSGEYAGIQTDYSGGSFRIEFDLQVTSRQDNSETNFGLFGPTYTSSQSLLYDKPCIYLSAGGSGNNFKLVVVTDNGSHYESSVAGAGLELYKWYRATLIYDSIKGRAAARVLERDTGERIWEDSLAAISGAFPLDMRYLGFSMVGSWATSGQIQESLIDNLKFVLAGAISGRVTRDDGITPIQTAQINANVYDLESSGPVNVAWSDSEADGAYYLSGIEPGIYKVFAVPPSGYGPQLYSLVDNERLSSPVTVQAGPAAVNIDFKLPPGGEISGHICKTEGLAPIKNAYVRMSKSNGDSYFHGQGGTDQSGAYNLRVAYGSYKLAAGGDRSNFKIEFYNQKDSFETADLVAVAPGQDPSGIDFNLDYGNSITGILFDNKLNRIPGVMVLGYNPKQQNGYGRLSDVMGKLFFNGRTNGVAELDAFPSLGTGFSWSGPLNRRDIFFTGGENIKDYPLFCFEGALATGYLKDTAGNPLSGITIQAGSRKTFYQIQSDINGRYQFRLPVGETTVYIEAGQQTNNYCALPLTVTVANKDVPVTIPDMIVFDESSGTRISGEVVDGGLDRDGIYMVGVVKAGTNVGPDNFYGFSPINNAVMEDAGTFSIKAIPPTAGLDPKYDIFFGVFSPNDLFGMPAYFSVRDYLGAVSAPASGLTFTYTSVGGSIDGEVTDAAGGPVMGAYVLFLRQTDNRFMGFATTDNLGRYQIKNFEPGTYYAVATNFRFLANASTQVSVAEGVQTSVPTLVLSSSDEDAIRGGFSLASSYVAAQDLDSFMGLFSDNYIDSGSTKDDMRQQMQGFFTNFHNTSFEFNVHTVDVMGDNALVKLGSVRKGYRNTDDTLTQELGKDILIYFRKESGIWKVYGNQELFPCTLTVGRMEQGNYEIHFSIDTLPGRITSASVAGPYVGVMTLYDDGTRGDMSANDGHWGNYAALGGNPPPVGLEYSFTITDSSGNTFTRKYAVTNIVEDAPQLISPLNDIEVTVNPVFQWTEVPVAYDYRLELLKGIGWSAENLVWIYNSTGKSDTQTEFGIDGMQKEPLQDGQTYSWRVYTCDQDNNRAVSQWGTFIYRGGQPNRMLLWNKLGSDIEVTHSEVGPNGTLIGALNYESCQFANGFRSLPRPDRGTPYNFPDYKIQLGHQGSVEFWYKPDWDGPAVGHMVYLFTYGIPGEPTGFRIAMGYNDTGNVFHATIYDADNPSDYVQTRISFPPPGWVVGQPVHLAVSWDDTLPPENRMVMYVNGVKVPQTVYFNGDAKVRSPDPLDFYLGMRMQPGEGHAWEGNTDGVIDNIKIWNYARSDFSDRFTEDGGPNVAPVAQSQNIVTRENTPVEIFLTATDANNQMLTYEIAGSPVSGTVTAPDVNRKVTYTPNRNYFGQDSFNFKAFDGQLYSDPASVNIIVKKNDPPIFDPAGDKTVDEAQILQFTVSATDPDGDSLTYSASNLPDGAAFDPATRAFSWTPTYNQAGIYEVIFKVTDTLGGEASETVQVTVKNVNRPPIARLTVLSVDGHTVRVSAADSSDPDTGDTLAYDWNFGDWPVRPVHSVEASHYYQNRPSGTYKITLTVSDSHGAISVASANVFINFPPTARIQFVIKRWERSYMFTGIGMDRDGSIVGYEWTSSRDGMLATTQRAYISNLSKGTHIISFRVKDNRGAWSTADTRTIIVKQ